ncbi:hypothetical protein BDV40DRAFT_290665 [Aspergillus tamarii]|uniref:HNH nuclease domain-containing protein n=1 Tax=Aspergillus tamarii TaxID=41984 RepID=A0A5N6UME8_ASPTM|nr:hypothetical protein BDV40DRAFT_290665 [Aspergillus tamarii]
MGPADELLDPQRHELIMQLLHIIEEPLVTSAAWACLWFADLSNVRKLIKQCEEDRLFCRTTKASLTSMTVVEMLKAWAVRSKNPRDAAEFDDNLEEHIKDSEDEEVEETPTKKRRYGSDSRKSSKIPIRTAKPVTGRSSATGSKKRSTSSSPTKSTGRKAAARKLCKERDNTTCVLTGFLEPLEIAHIYPYSLGQKGKKDLEDFWNILGIFWTSDMVEAWEKQVLGPDGTEACSNLMCMVNVAHKLWEKARFALKPLSLREDQKVLTVQFYWLPRNSYSRKMPAIDIPGPFPSNLSSSKVGGRHSAKLFNISTDTKICSGDILTFETNDPINHPLPSMELLNMQWVLHRVLALSGAADANDEDLESEADKYFQFISSELDQMDTEEDAEEEMEEMEEEQPEEGRGTEGEAWEEIAVEAPRVRSSRNTRTDENVPIRESRPRSRLPRPNDVEHKVGGERMGQEEQAEEESSSFVLGFRNINIR